MDFRGRAVIFNEVAVCVGCVVGMFGGSSAIADGVPWRSVIGLSAIPVGVQLLSLAIMPESPRWLAVQGRVDEMLKAAARLGLTAKEIENMVKIPKRPPLREALGTA